MASYVYADGKYHMLAGNKIANNGELLSMKHTDRIVADGEDYPLGVATIDVDEPAIPDIPDAPEPTLKSLVHEQGDEPTGGTVFYITPDGAGNMDGTSWEHAASQSMIHAILLSTVSGDRVYFMEGTYDGVTRPITVPPGVSFYGGFSSSDTSWGARDAFNHQTICQPANFTGTFAEIAEAVSGQVIDGFVLIGYTDTSSDGTNITYRNMTVNGGEFLTLGDVYNCQFVDCILTTNDTEKVIVSSIEAKNMTVTGSLTNVTVSLNGGTLTCNGVPNSYIVESNVTTTGTVSESVIVNTTAVTNVTGDVNTSTIYGETAVVGNITESNIYGDVTCQGNITGNIDKNIITGKVVCDSIINYICDGSAEVFSKIENCVLKSTATSPLGTDNVYTTQEKDLFIVDALGWQQDDGVECSYYIKQGYLYFQGGTQVGTLQGWTAISGHYSSINDYCAYGICNGELYELQRTTATKISTGGSNWTAISGYCHSDSAYHSYAYGICNGELYQLYETTATKISTGGSGWTAISGFSSNSSYVYGICNGQLYMLSHTTATKISTGSNGWTAISGYYSPSYGCAYGICNGELYALQRTTATKISTGGNGWTAISGHSLSSGSSSVFTYYAYGICNGQLYALQRTTATKISTGGNGWTSISGYSGSSSSYSYYAYGICNGQLYVLNQTIATKISTGGSNWTAISGYSYSSYYAYGICNGNLYQLSATKATLIGVCVYNSIGTSSSCSFLNSTQSVGTAANCEFINCENEALVASSAKFCTFTNCKGSVPSGRYNIFWNCTGTIPATNNAQSTDNTDNLLTLDADNTIARFTNTGFYPAQGMQDVGQPPSPITDPTGYQNWIDQFGNFQPASNSSLKGLAPLDSNVPADIDGTTRLDPTTPGAYETAVEQNEQEYSPLTFKATQASSSVTLNAKGSPTVDGLQYRIGASEQWLPYTTGTTIELTNEGDTVQFQNTKEQLSTDRSNYVQFSMVGQIEASGNIQSMLNYSQRCTDYCYYQMFASCSSLTTAPQLPATTLANHCYSYMFHSCYSLTTAPQLPATTLANYCYNDMFFGCYYLTEAPELPATTLVPGCYDNMFYNCSSLKYIKVHFINWLEYTTTNWVINVDSTGTFVKPTALPETTGTSNIPEGWTITNY